MTKKLLVFVLVLFSAGFSYAQRGGRTQGGVLEIKVASQMPENSIWGTALNRIASEWNRITGGQVQVRPRHNGLEGGEGKMLTSLEANQIQGAVFTSFGISKINSDIMTLSCPFLIRNDDELNYVFTQVEEDLEAKINREGKFFVAAWSQAGWINVFSKEPVLTSEELRRQRLATNPEAEDLNAVFRTMGFNLVEVDTIDTASKIASGAINAVYQIPTGVAAYQLYKTLNNMVELNIAPVIGAIVINRVTWDKVPAQYRDEMVKAARRIARDMDASSRKTNEDAIAMMRRQGLKVNRLSAAQTNSWSADLTKAIPNLLGVYFNRNLYLRIDEMLKKRRGGR
jgi:TRAP-type C4-dicarboxylate transport system substrate-binding protein